jgi:hypothetical protein
MNSQDHQHEMHPFRVDPGWYEAHWLTPATPKGPSAFRRGIAGLIDYCGVIAERLGNLWRGVEDLPSEFAKHEIRL